MVEGARKQGLPNGKKMTILNLSRYLFVVTTLAFLLVSSTTYAPPAEKAGEALMWILAFLSFLFAGLTFFLSAQRTRHPERPLFRSRALHFILLALAIIATVLLVVGVAG